jgi:hypothetical protein
VRFLGWIALIWRVDVTDHAVDKARKLGFRDMTSSWRAARALASATRAAVADCSVLTFTW